MPSLRQRLKQLHFGEVYLETNAITTMVKESWGTGWSTKQVARSLLKYVFDFNNDRDLVGVGSEPELVFASCTAVASLASFENCIHLIDESTDLSEKDFMTAVACLLREKIIPVVVVNDRGIAFGMARKNVKLQYFDLSSTVGGTSIFLFGCEPSFTSVLEDVVSELGYECRMENRRLRQSKTRLPTIEENNALALLIEAVGRFVPNLANHSIQYAVAPTAILSEWRRDCSSPIDDVFLIDSTIFVAELGLAFSSFLREHLRRAQQYDTTVLYDTMEAIINGYKEFSRFESNWRKTVQSIESERANSSEDNPPLQWLASLSRERLIELAGRLPPDIVAQAKNDWELPF